MSVFGRRFQFASVHFGSVAELNDTPKGAVRAAGIGGISDVAIHLKQGFLIGGFQESTSELERQVLADINRLMTTYQAPATQTRKVTEFRPE